MRHYQVPDTEEERSIFYGGLYDIFFGGPDAPTPNKNYPEIEVIKGSMLQGGFYRFDLAEKLSLLSLNSIFYSKKNLADIKGE